MGSHETVRFGEANVSGLETNQEGVAHNSVDLDETQEGENLRHGCWSRGFGSVSLAECLDRMGTQSSTTFPATCASGEGNESTGSSPHSTPQQVMTPNSSQTFPQDPFRTRKPPQVDTHPRHQRPSWKRLMSKKKQSLQV